MSPYRPAPPSVPEASEDRSPSPAVSPTLADVFRRYGDAYLATHSVTAQQRTVMEAIRQCRTFARGYHVDVCVACGHAELRPNSCGNRHCPTCQGKDRVEWVEARMKELLPVPYFHVVFTLPGSIYPLCLYNQKIVYDLLFHSAAETLKTFGRDPQWLGAEKLGFFGVLHTWGQTLSCHPHVHFVVPAGGVDAHGDWVWPTDSKNHFLFPVHALAKVYRGKFIAGLKQTYAKGALQFPGDLTAIADEEGFDAWLDAMVATNWVVYAKAPFSGPAQVVRSVSRSTHRAAISNQRLLSIEEGIIRFTYKNYQKKGEGETDEALWEEMELPAEEFIRRFLHHILPPGYHRIRYDGFLSGSQKDTLHAIREELVFEEERGVLEVTRTLWLGRPCPQCDLGVLAVALVVTAHGQVVYEDRDLLEIFSVTGSRLDVAGWDTS